MAEILSYNHYRDMHNDVQLSAMFFGKNFQNIPLFNSTQTIEAKRLCYSFEHFTFTGKERDSETGFSYFGARYYDSDILTGWLSVGVMEAYMLFGEFVDGYVKFYKGMTEEE